MFLQNKIGRRKQADKRFHGSRSGDLQAIVGTVLCKETELHGGAALGFYVGRREERYEVGYLEIVGGDQKALE